MWGFPGGSVVKNSPDNAGNQGSSHGFRRSPGEVNGNPFQYPCLGNPMDRLQSMGHKRVGHGLVTKQQQPIYV